MRIKSVSLNSLLQNNKMILLVSFIAALVIWIGVSPNREATIQVSLNMTTKNTAAGALGLEIVEGQKQTVDVKVSGKWYLINQLTEKDVRVIYSLSSVDKAGEYEIKLTAEKTSAVKDFEILSVTPEKVKIKLGSTTIRSYAVQAQVTGVKAAEGLIAGQPVPSNDKIEISGTLEELQKISSVVASVQVNETLSKTTSYPAKIKLLDADGKELDQSVYVLPFTEIDITVPLNKTATLPVTASFMGQPEGFAGKVPHTVKIDGKSGSSVSVTGQLEIIDTLKSIELDAIDFANVKTGSNVFKIKAKLPSGLQLAGTTGETAVTEFDTTVTVNVDGYKPGTASVSDIRVVSAAEGQKISIVTDKQTVTFMAPSDAVATLSGASFYLEADMSALSGAKGEHIVPATVKCTANNKVWAVGVYQIQVKIT